MEKEILPSGEELAEAKNMWTELKDEGEPREDLLAQVEAAEAEPEGIAGQLKRMYKIHEGKDIATDREVKDVKEMPIEELKREFRLLYQMRTYADRSRDEVGLGMTWEEFTKFADMRSTEIQTEVLRRNAKIYPDMQ